MEASALHIRSMKDAIANGSVPGSFNADRTVWSFPTLSYTGARGATHQWTVRVSLLPAAPVTDEMLPITDEMLDQPVFALSPDSRAEIMVESLQVGGKIRSVVPTYVSVGKNLGKANATNALTQALRDALGKYLKQRKRADLVVVPGAEAAAVTEEPAAEPAAATAPATEEPALAAKESTPPAAYDPRPPPMLVKKLGDSREATFTPATFAEGVTAQRKLNGVHLVTYAVPGPPVQILRYSRTATSYPGQAHLAAELLPMFLAAPAVVPGKYGLPADAPPELIAAYAGTPAPVYLDGELYKHGKSLNWISGQARRGDDEGLLEFHVFDVFFPRAMAVGHDMASRDRQQYLRDFFAAGAAAAHPHVVSVDNFPVRDMAELQALAKRFAGEAEGYEGAIARKDGAGYRYSYSNYHSANLVKVKAILDDEFPVVGFTQGTKGKDVGALVWICEVLQPLDPADRTFNVVPKNMTYEDRRALFRCLGELVDGPGGARVTRFERDFRGKPLTVSFPERSAKTGKPLQAKALIFRTYEGGPEADPVRRALEECGAAS